mmetsp:Transcript_26185/g.52979  ORF Transcript_26185/g.52979 Transcript_26185/m.52979 type:complete len:271 (-) Transcript_26185:186-998(-)
MVSDTERARELMRAAQRILVLTGAGISTDSGIPDFRGPNGLWTRNPKAEKASRLEFWIADAEVRAARWEQMARQRGAGPSRQPRPNRGHEAVAALAATGRMSLLVTQNVDGLHQEAGVPPEGIVEVHGSTRSTRCLDCGQVRPMGETLDRFEAGDRDPQCRQCGGMLKTATISFGQALIEEDLDRAFQAARECDLLVAVGSTLSVYPVAGIVPAARDAGAKVIIVNAQATEMDELADVVVNASISEVLPPLITAVSSSQAGPKARAASKL